MRILGLTITRERVRQPSVLLREVHDQVHRLEMDLRQVQDELSQLQGQHLKLRKQFDGSKGGRPREDEPLPDDKASRKRAMRERIGLVPGRPAPSI